MKDISQFQKALLMVYKEFASFCEQHNITFYAANGKTFKFPKPPYQITFCHIWQQKRSSLSQSTKDADSQYQKKYYQVRPKQQHTFENKNASIDEHKFFREQNGL